MAANLFLLFSVCFLSVMGSLLLSHLKYIESNVALGALFNYTSVFLEKEREVGYVQFVEMR